MYFNSRPPRWNGAPDPQAPNFAAVTSLVTVVVVVVAADLRHMYALSLLDSVGQSTQVYNEATAAGHPSDIGCGKRVWETDWAAGECKLSLL